MVCTFVFSGFASEVVAAPIGETTETNKEVTGQLGAVARTLAVGAPVSSNETVRTGRGSSAVLRFLDNSTLNIGEASTVVLDQFIYDPNRGSQDAIFSLAKGAMRFVSGGVRTRDATVGTPVGVIGIRGTDILVVCKPGPECATIMGSGRARICPVPEGTPIGPELRAACLRRNTGLLPCGFFEVAGEDARRGGDEGNFTILQGGCVFSPPVFLDTSSFNFVAQQVAVGAPVPDPSLISSLASTGTTSVTTAAAGAATGTTATSVATTVGVTAAVGAGVTAVAVGIVELQSDPVSDF